MTDELKKGDYLHKEYPKTRSPDDFWGQVSRTVNGVAVSQEQIDMIVHSVVSGLNLCPDDTLLDIGCGNGALSRYFFEKCSHFHGVDFSSYLIQVAKENFERKPAYVFTEMDAIKFTRAGDQGGQFTKALCYGAFTYFSQNNAEKLLQAVAENYPNLDRFFIGNLPDKAKSDVFLKGRKSASLDLNDCTSPIGIWRTKEEFTSLANDTGWEPEFSYMPKNFYAAHYRYDVLLVRK